jgi:hypothetical protein
MMVGQRNWRRNKIGLGHIWQNQTKNQRGTVCEEVKESCNDIESQNLFANLGEKRSLILYHDMKLLWDREDYVMCGSRNDRRGIAWFRAGTWKLRGTRKYLEIRRCGAYFIKLPRNKKADRTPEREMADN